MQYVTHQKMLMPNASLRLLPEAGAQRTLEAVSCKALILIEAPSPADHRGMLNGEKGYTANGMR
jgi:hypothetical protein